MPAPVERENIERHRSGNGRDENLPRADCHSLVSQFEVRAADSVINYVRAVVAWYGPTARAYHAGDKTPLDVAPQIKAAVLGLYGGADGGIPNDTVEKMFAALKAAGNTKSEYTIYPDTPHAFNADYRPSYRKAQAEDAWNKMIAWFKLHL